MAGVSGAPIDNAPVPRLVLNHLTKDFPLKGGRHLRAVDDLTLNVEQGEWLVLACPSGCGKTTLLRLVAGLEQPTAGTVEVDGRCANEVAPRDRGLAMVFQSPALYPHLSVFENMAFGLQIRHATRQETAEQVRAAAAMLGLADCLDRMPAELSGGQRQRVALGRALARRPGLLLLDEPLSNLDSQTRGQLRLELLELRSRLATTAIYVTHNQREAMTLGTRLGILKQGVLQQIGPARELYEQPANIFVAGFLGSPGMNFWKGTLVRTPAGLGFHTSDDGNTAPSLIPVSTEVGNAPRLSPWLNRHLVMGLRPEHVSVCLAGSEGGLDAVVEAAEELGAEIYVHLHMSAGCVIARVPTGISVKPHETLKLKLDTRAAHFFDPETERAIP